jgi:phosphonate transport system substrate-binding protein
VHFDRHRITLTGLIISASMLIAPLSLAAAEAPAPHEYNMGTFPFLPPANLESIFAPISAEISAAVGRPVRMRATSSFDGFTKAIVDKKFDIVQMQPFDYVRVGKQAGYIPLVARTEPLYAHFSAKTDSKIKKLADLKGGTLGLPPDSSAVSYLAKATLQSYSATRGNAVAYRYFPNHLACLQQLLIGTVDACATSAPAARLFESQSGVRLAEIGKSRTIPHAMFAVHKRINPTDRAKIKATLLSTTLSGVDPKLRKLFIDLDPTDGIHYFKPVTDKDYDSARQILNLLE